MITYGEYKKLGYSAVPKEQFARFADTAEKAVRKFCRYLDSVNDDGKRCLCEICDIYFAENNAGRLAGFTNDGYREQYFESNISRRVFELVQLYFPRSQIFRGV